MPPPLPRCSGWVYSSLNITHPYQPSPVPLPCRPAHRPFRGLLSVHSRCGLHTRAVTYTWPLSEGFRHFVTSMPAPVASGWSGCRAGLAPAGEAPPFHGARGKRTFAALRGRIKGRRRVRIAVAGQKPWAAKWIEDEAAKSQRRTGGQGIVKRVHRRDDPEASVFVLKELKEQKSLERRARMYREVVALRDPSTPLDPTSCRPQYWQLQRSFCPIVCRI